MLCSPHTELEGIEEGTRAGVPGTLVGADITTDKTWLISGSPYLITTNVTVRSGVTLQIDPGVEVLFEYGTSFTIAGRLRAHGQLFNPIVFEPFDDPAPRDWIGLRFLESSWDCTLNWTTIRFADGAVNCTYNTSPMLNNCTIDTSHFYGIYCGPYSDPVIRNCNIETAFWSGIICDNRSDPVISNNIIDTCQYGVVCYSPAKVTNNTIHKCWVAVLCWGDATVDNNTISNFCTDGIQAFHSDPVIKYNYIDGCMGNGTRFTFSNATVLNNSFRSNKVGMDISYEAKGVLANMQGNLVNGIDVKDLFYIDEHDIVIEGLTMRSGWSYYKGYLTAQGSVTLFDCSNVTFKDCTIANSMNSIYAANSTLCLYNTTLENAEQSELFLMMNSQAKSYNESVDVSEVTIKDPDCLFTSYDDIRVTVLDHDLVPIEGATVVVKEDLIELHNITTDSEGMTPNLVVKDRAVSSSGIIPSPLTVVVYAEGYNFGDNPREDVYAAETEAVEFVDLGDIWAPTVTEVNIEHGDKTVEIERVVTVTFSEEMNQTVTENAFVISGDITGTFSWSGFNLTFTPSQGFEYQTYYTVTIGETASDVAGNTLEAPYVFSFTTIPEPKTASLVLIAVAVVAVVAVMGVGSWLVLKRFK
ncbi:MAG: hypothetical protein AYK23_02525 [Candidatus Proteinoplasmatales archaeon SG8-5]|nr:MAG: hypothetical protein AYK23_02525 [Candidatus Proteinoplasmatales archaeon SG8-5]